MNNTVNDLFSVITSDDGLMEFLWLIALGEPIPPDGDVYEAGDSELAEAIYALFFPIGEEITSLENIVTGSVVAVRTQAASLNERDVDGLSEGDWAQVRNLLLNHGKGRGIPCQYCECILWGGREEFENHYREERCWEN